MSSYPRLEHMLNGFQYLNEWERLSFTLFGDEEKEVDKYITYIKHRFLTDEHLHDYMDGLQDEDNTTIIRNILVDQCVLSCIDSYTLSWISNEEADTTGMPRPLPMIRYKGNRVYFHSIFINPNMRGVSEYFRYRLFYAPYVYPNVMDSLSQQTLVILAEERYPERYAKFLDHFKKNGTILQTTLGNNITMIIIDYVQPSKFRPDFIV